MASATKKCAEALSVHARVKTESRSFSSFFGRIRRTPRTVSCMKPANSGRCPHSWLFPSCKGTPRARHKECQYPRLSCAAGRACRQVGQPLSAPLHGIWYGTEQQKAKSWTQTTPCVPSMGVSPRLTTCEQVAVAGRAEAMNAAATAASKRCPEQRAMCRSRHRAMQFKGEPAVA